MRWLAILVLLLALAAAGCGGSDNESAATETTAETATTTVTATEESTTDATSTNGTDLSAVLADEDCLALASAGAAFAQALASGSTSADSQTLEELASKVPDEIKADVQKLADAYAKYAAELKDVGIESGQTPSAEQLQKLQAALASFDQQGVNEASARLSAWAQKNCPGG